MNEPNQEPVTRRRPGRPRRDEQATSTLRPDSATGRLQVCGRDGAVLMRKRTGNIDPYAIPPHVIPEGWDYQWNTYTVAGEQAVDSQILMAENGWRPVPSERHEGMFMPEGYKGQILRGGLRLEERPLALTIEARNEEYAKAKGQVSDQNAQLGMGAKVNFGRGHEARNFLGNGQAVRTALETSGDVPRPRVQIDPEG